MDSDTINEVQLLSRDFYDATEAGQTFTAASLQKYAAHLNNILRRLRGGQSIAELVRDWVASSSGGFVFSQMCVELGLKERTEKRAADMALRRLAEKGQVEEGGKRGHWRPLAVETEVIDWEKADPDDLFNIKWPLELEKIANTCPKNIIILAGEKNAGKTAFCMETAYLNSADHEVWYFSSEMVAQELSRRIRLYPEKGPFQKVHFRMFEGQGLGDLVRPNAINIFDFLELTDEFWLIARAIKHVFNKLENGIAIIAIQKDVDARWGRGKGFSNEKARIYLTLKPGLLTTEVVKDYVGAKSPDGKSIPFVLENNAVFVHKPNPNNGKNRPLATVKPIRRKEPDGGIPPTPPE